MKQFLLFISLLTIVNFGFAQNQLVSYFNSYSEVHGGMEDGGISRNESYFFKVNAKITLLDIYVYEKQLVLKKGDTLVINVGKFTPYNTNKIELSNGSKSINEKPAEVIFMKRFDVHQVGRIYYANVHHTYVWDKTLKYQHKKETYVVKTKEGFDDGDKVYAP